LELSRTVPQRSGYMKRPAWIATAVAVIAVVAVLVWRGIVSLGNPDPLAVQTSRSAAVFDIAVLVLREGLECILVLAAITAGLIGEQQRYRRPVAAGAGVGLVATLATWGVAVRILDDISNKVSALQLQAATGLLAVIVLLIVMNWFFHKLYWTGWISLHNRRKRELLEESHAQHASRRMVFGMGLLGFSSFYREGVELCCSCKVTGYDWETSLSISAFCSALFSPAWSLY
jgi:high-affinity iron transporter